MSDQSYLEIGRGIRNVYTFVTTLTRRLDLSPRVVHGVFNPEVVWDGQDLAVAQQRYGVDFTEAYKIGDGEAFGPDAVLEVALHPSNPLGINQSLITLRPGGGVKDSRIYTDCMIVGASPTALAWRWFQAKHAELFGVAPPVDPPPPPPPIDPPPPPPPPPVDPPVDPVDPPPPHVCPPCPPCPPAWPRLGAAMRSDAEKILAWGDIAVGPGKIKGAKSLAQRILSYDAWWRANHPGQS